MRAAAVVVLLFLAAAAFRLAIVRAYYTGSPDGVQYNALASELRAHGRFAFSKDAPPTYARMPGYPLFLAAFAVGDKVPWDDSVVRAVTANVVLDLLTALGLLLIARELGLGRAEGYAAVVLVALCPLMFLLSAYLLSESLATCLGTLAFLFAVRAHVRDRRGYAVAAGALAGAAMLVRADMVTLVPALLLLTWNRAWTPRRRLGHAGLLVAAFAVVLSPWALRNLVRFGAPHLTATEWPAEDGEPLPTGPMAWMRTWANGGTGDGDLSGRFVFRQHIDVAKEVQPRMYDSDDERARLVAAVGIYNAAGLTPEVNARFEALAAERRRAHPWHTLVYLPWRRAQRLYAPLPAGDYPIRVRFLALPQLRRAIFLGANVVIYGLAIAGGLVLLRRARAVALALGVAIAARTVVHMWAVPTFVSQRYLVEVMPLLVLCAAVAVGTLLARLRERRLARA